MMTLNLLPREPLGHRRYRTSEETASAKRRRQEDPLRYQLNDIRRRCKKAGVPFDLLVEDITVPERCPLLGIPLFRGGGVTSDNTPSVDRIDPSKGYTHDNVHVVSWRANRIKQNATLEELVLLTDNLREIIRSKGVG